jgi:hypothetical protein
MLGHPVSRRTAHNESGLAVSAAAAYCESETSDHALIADDLGGGFVRWQTVGPRLCARRRRGPIEKI